MTSEISFTPDAFHGAPVRANDLHYIVSRLRRGKCCAVVGCSNMGKSMLLRSLITEEVRQKCSDTDGKPVITVFVDCLAIEDETMFYARLLSKLIDTLQQTTVVQDSVLHNFMGVLDKVLNSQNARLARFYTVQTLNLLKHADARIVLVLDEFDRVFGQLTERTFNELRSLHDTLNQQLLYVVGSVKRLESIHSGQELFEFRELFRMNTLLLRPLTAADASILIDGILAKSGTQFDKSTAEWAQKLSGGHPGLLARIVELMAARMPGSNFSVKDLSAQFCSDIRIRKECQRLWNELDASEQQVLIDFVSGKDPSDDEARQYLLDTGIIRSRAKKTERKDVAHIYCVFSPIFLEYILGQVPWPGGLGLLEKEHRISCDDIDITAALTVKEYALLAYFLKNPASVRSVVQIGEAVWGWRYTPDIVRATVRRVRRKIEPHVSHPIYLTNVRGQGYMLEPHPQLRNLRDSIWADCLDEKR